MTRRSKTTAFLVAVAIAAALGFVTVLFGGCMNEKAVEACGKACGPVGVKFVNSDVCQCNPRQEAVCK